MSILDMVWLVMSLAMLGKLCIASAYQVIYLYGAELIPTEMRLFGLGTCNVMARFGSISCPYITDLLVSWVLKIKYRRVYYFLLFT